MSFKPIAKEIREQILAQIKEGASVSKTAIKFNVSPKTIYGWLAKESCSQVSLLQYNRLKRERDDLLKIIGKLTLDLSRSKKKKDD